MEATRRQTRVRTAVVAKVHQDGSSSNSSEDFQFSVRGTFIDVDNKTHSRKLPAMRRARSASPAKHTEEDEEPADAGEEEYTKSLNDKLRMWKMARACASVCPTSSTLDALPAGCTLESLPNVCPSPWYSVTRTMDSMPHFGAGALTCESFHCGMSFISETQTDKFFSSEAQGTSSMDVGQWAREPAGRAGTSSVPVAQFSEKRLSSLPGSSSIDAPQWLSENRWRGQGTSSIESRQWQSEMRWSSEAKLQPQVKFRSEARVSFSESEEVRRFSEGKSPASSSLLSSSTSKGSEDFQFSLKHTFLTIEDKKPSNKKRGARRRASSDPPRLGENEGLLLPETTQQEEYSKLLTDKLRIWKTALPAGKGAGLQAHGTVAANCPKAALPTSGTIEPPTLYQHKTLESLPSVHEDTEAGFWDDDDFEPIYEEAFPNGTLPKHLERLMDDEDDLHVRSYEEGTPAVSRVGSMQLGGSVQLGGSLQLGGSMQLGKQAWGQLGQSFAAQDDRLRHRRTLVAELVAEADELEQNVPFKVQISEDATPTVSRAASMRSAPPAYSYSTAAQDEPTYMSSSAWMRITTPAWSEPTQDDLPAMSRTGSMRTGALGCGGDLAAPLAQDETLSVSRTSSMRVATSWGEASIPLGAQDECSGLSRTSSTRVSSSWGDASTSVSMPVGWQDETPWPSPAASMRVDTSPWGEGATPVAAQMGPAAQPAWVLFEQPARAQVPAPVSAPVAPSTQPVPACVGQPGRTQHLAAETLAAAHAVPGRVADLLHTEFVTLVNRLEAMLQLDMQPFAGKWPHVDAFVKKMMQNLLIIPSGTQGVFKSAAFKAESLVANLPCVPGPASSSEVPKVFPDLDGISCQVREIAQEALREAIRMWNGQAMHILNYALICVQKEGWRLQGAQKQLSVALGRMAQLDYMQFAEQVAATVARLALVDLHAATYSAEAPGPRLAQESAHSAPSLQLEIPPPPAPVQIEIPPPPQAAAWSCGSRGHPFLCARPCRFHSEGACDNGQQCGFCHLPHDRREVHMDKKMRATFKQLPQTDKASLVGCALADKVKESGLGREAMEAIVAWGEEIGVPLCFEPKEQLGCRATDGRRLRLCIQSLTFMALCGLLHVSAEDERGANVTQALLDRLRGLLPAQEP